MHYSPHQLAYVDLKVGKLAHGDLGQMLVYANYYDPRSQPGTTTRPSA